jgi:hypothetical protein
VGESLSPTHSNTHSWSRVRSVRVCLQRTHSPWPTNNTRSRPMAPMSSNTSCVKRRCDHQLESSFTALKGQDDIETYAHLTRTDKQAPTHAHTHAVQMTHTQRSGCLEDKAFSFVLPQALRSEADDRTILKHAQSTITHKEAHTYAHTHTRIHTVQTDLR